MKKSIIFTLGLMLGVFGMTGCSKDAANEHINGDVDVKEFTLISHAAAPDTRMVIEGDKTNGFNTAWEDGDKIGVYAMPADTTGINTTYFTCNQAHTGTVADGIATFVGTIRSTNNEDYNLFAYYPYTSGSNYLDTNYQTGVKCAIAATQTMNGNSFDKSCAYMVAKTGQTVNTDAINYSAPTANWQFRHVTAFINLGTKAITADGVSGEEIVKSATIEAVGIETNPTLAGSFQFNLENGEMTFTDETPQNAVTVNVPDGTTLANLSAWFVTNPFTLTADDKLEIVINTKTHVIKKNVTIAKSFEAANAYTLNLTIDNNCNVSDAPEEPVGPANGTILWSENWNNCAKDSTPTSNTDGTVVYNDGTVNYTYVDGKSTTKIYEENLAGGTSPELLINQTNSSNNSNGSWTISNIPTGNCSEATLTFKINKATATYCTITSDTDNVTIGTLTSIEEDTNKYTHAYLIRFNNVQTFSLTFTNSSSSNCRIDDIELVVGNNVPTPKASTPANLAVSTDADAGSFTATWDSATGASEYAWRLVEDDATTDLQIGTTIETSVTCEGLDTAKKYVLYVKSVGDGTNYLDSDEASINVSFSADYSAVYTSNVTLDTTGGTNASTGTVKIDSSSYNAIKIGTSNKGGTWVVTVPAGTTKLHLHAVAWNGVSNLSLNITGATCSPDSIALTANSGATNNSPFTLSLPLSNDYFEIELSNITAETKLTFTTSTTKRFIVWGVNAE